MSEHARMNAATLDWTCMRSPASCQSRSSRALALALDSKNHDRTSMHGIMLVIPTASSTTWSSKSARH